MHSILTIQTVPNENRNFKMKETGLVWLCRNIFC